MDDLISRHAAIATAISGRVRTLPTTEDGEDWIRVNEVRESLLSLPSAQPGPCEDTVSRKAVEKMLKNGFPARGMWEIEGDVVKQTVCETLADALMELESLPSAQPEIEYRDCANAMLRMWMDNVVTDGEYNRIMAKLNAYWRKDEDETN